jgi:hypothetical protein
VKDSQIIRYSKGRGGKAIEKRPERHSNEYQSPTKFRVVMEAFHDDVSFPK